MSGQYSLFRITSLALTLLALTGCQTVRSAPVTGDKIGMVLMHGKRGTDRLVFSLRGELERAGILVETPLMPWSRDRIYDKSYEESIVELDAVVARLKARGTKRIFVAGHSLGANVALGYGARRDGLSGVILLAYGHVPGLSGFASKLFDSVVKARTMIAAGKGEKTASFADAYHVSRYTVVGSANDVLSWFDPDGPATLGNNAPRVKPHTPVLCVDGARDRLQRCHQILPLLPENPATRSVTVDADHRGTPAQSGEAIVRWLRLLRR